LRDVDRRDGNLFQLALGLGTMSICFAAVGSLAGMMPILSERLKLNEAQVGFALAMPVVLGSVCRVFLGVLTDRFGGRAVCQGVMMFAISPVLLIAFSQSYGQVLACALLIGVPLAIFPVGVVFVSDWFPPHRQGLVLGLIGFANLGHSMALFAAPLVVDHFGYQWGFWIFALLLAAWLLIFSNTARNGRIRQPSRLREFIRPLTYRLSWILGLFYFLTFGGFLVMSAYLPKFLTLILQLTKAEAGLRAAIFVIFAGALRPVGGLLADRIGGKATLLLAFAGLVLVGVCMAYPAKAAFTFGAIGFGVAIGLGNGAVFKLVPQHFPRSVGTVTGVVGAIGAIGAFFPPIVLGLIHRATGAFTWGFILLSIFATICLSVCALALPATARETS
jgi:NNP family nitrate/nitrite transporter-like MFS transporter